MKKSNSALLAACLLCTSDFLYSDEATPLRLERENLMFSVLLTSGGSTGCSSSRSVKIINTHSDLIESFNYLYECSSQKSSEIEPPNVDLTTGSAVLLDIPLGQTSCSLSLREFL